MKKITYVKRFKKWRKKKGKKQKREKRKKRRDSAEVVKKNLCFEMKASREKKEQESNLRFSMEEKTGDGRIMERQDNRRRVENSLRRKGH